MKKIASFIIGSSLAAGAIAQTADPTMVVTMKNGKTFEYNIPEIELVTFHTEGSSIPDNPNQKYETTVTEAWTKTGDQLGLQFPAYARDICVAGDYLLVLDNTIAYDATAKIKAYNKYTGEFVKDVAIYEGGWNGPRSYTWTLSSDEAGNFAMGRLNSGGAGFWMDSYTDIDAMPTNPFKLGASEVPENSGRRMQLLGNIFSGKGLVCTTSSHFYGVTPMQGQYCTWNMTDGVPTTAEPEIGSYPAQWHHAIVQRQSLDDETLYVTYTDESTYPNDPFDTWDNLHGAHFAVYTPGSAAPSLEMDPKCFKYRILDANVFFIKNARYYFTLQMGYSTGTSPMCTALYDITGDGAFSTNPTAADYSNYKIFESADYVSSNDNRIGSVTVWVDKATDTAYLYAFYPAATGDQAKITCHKMVLGAPID